MLPNEVVSTGLPSWLIALGVILAIILTCFKVVEYIKKFLAKPGLDVHLTREIFFRCLLPPPQGLVQGEVLFANAVLLARNGAVLIQDVRLNLKKTSGSNKNFPLHILQFGEKTLGVGPIAEHNFYTSSPLSYMPQDKPQRIIYLAVVEEYAASIKKITEKSASSLKAYIEKLNNEYELLSEEEKNNRIPQEKKVLEQMASNFSSDIMELVQLEKGDYELEIVVNYKSSKNAILLQQKESRSCINFNVSEGFRDLYKTKLNDLALDLIHNFINKTNHTPTYPEYVPDNIREL